MNLSTGVSQLLRPVQSPSMWQGWRYKLFRWEHWNQQESSPWLHWDQNESAILLAAFGLCLSVTLHGSRSLSLSLSFSAQRNQVTESQANYCPRLGWLHCTATLTGAPSHGTGETWWQRAKARAPMPYPFLEARIGGMARASLRTISCWLLQQCWGPLTYPVGHGTEETRGSFKLPLQHALVCPPQPPQGSILLLLLMKVARPFRNKGRKKTILFIKIKTHLKWKQRERQKPKQTVFGSW